MVQWPLLFGDALVLTRVFKRGSSPPLEREVSRPWLVHPVLDRTFLFPRVARAAESLLLRSTGLFSSARRPGPDPGFQARLVTPLEEVSCVRSSAQVWSLRFSFRVTRTPVYLTWKAVELKPTTVSEQDQLALPILCPVHLLGLFLSYYSSNRTLTLYQLHNNADQSPFSSARVHSKGHGSFQEPLRGSGVGFLTPFMDGKNVSF